MTKGGRVYILLTVLFALVCLSILIRADKGTIHLLMDEWHTGTNPTFFTYWTYLGDGIAFGVVVLLLLAMRQPGTVVLSTAATGITVLIVVGFLKNLVFQDVDRPWGFFEESALRIIPGLEQHEHNSFPSGHTTAAFALCGILSFWINKRGISILLFVLALSIGYSRIYLNQHFLIDVFVGAVMGSTLAWLNYLVFSGISNIRLRSRLI